MGHNLIASVVMVYTQLTSPSLRVTQALIEQIKVGVPEFYYIPINDTFLNCLFSGDLIQKTGSTN